MKLVTINGKTYKEIDETYFDSKTTDEVCNILASALHTNRRLRLFYGDTATGKDWNEEHDTIGYIGRSTGNIKIPLLIKNNTSTGGGAILDHCIVKITEGQKVLYIHPSYNSEKFIAQGIYVYTENGKQQYWAMCNNEQQAVRLAAFMNGERNSK
jgi:hypothetical protein